MSRTYHVTRAQAISKDCLVCGIDNDWGLHGQFLETEENELISIYQPLFKHQSYPDHTHGGIICAMLDEAIGRAIKLIDENIWGVTAKLEIKYRKPTPYGETLYALTRITRHRGRLFEGSGELVTADGTVVAEASAVFVRLTLEQIAHSDDFDGDANIVDERPVPATFDFPAAE